MDEVLTEVQWKAWWKKQGEPSDERCEHADNPFTSISPMLQKHMGTYVKSASKVLVTLCGSSPDLKWLADNGHSVYGVEWSEDAILQFLKKCNLQYEKSEMKNFTVFKVANLDLRFYVGDFLNFTHENIGVKFDFIWDSASLQTIPLSSRQSYSKVILDLMHPDSVYMLSAMYFGELRTWKENPYELSDNDLMELYGNNLAMTTVELDKSEYGDERIIVFKFK